MHIMGEIKTIFYSWEEIDNKTMDVYEQNLFSEKWIIDKAINCQNGIKVTYSR